MTVTLDTCRDVRLSSEAFWRIVEDARLATRQDLCWRFGAYTAEWCYYANGKADHLGPRDNGGPIMATVTRD